MARSFLIVGLGRFGKHMAKSLSALNNEVLAIDINEDRVNDALKYLTDARIGDATNEHFLREMGINNFDVCICAIGDNFQASLETTCLMHELGAKYVFARANRDIHKKFLLRNGADEVINPEKQIAEWAAIRYSSNHVLDYIKLDNSHAIFEVAVPPDWIGRTVGQIDIRKRYGINIMAVKEAGKMDLSVTPETVLTDRKTMLVLGERKAIQKCFRI